MSGGDYRWHQKNNQAVGGTVNVNTTGATGTTSPISGGTGSASGAIFVQLLEVAVTTGATGVTWDFQGSSGSQSITGLVPVNTVGLTRFDFGPRGVQLTTGSNFQLVTSATGTAGVINWEGYKKYMGGTSVGTFSASGASGSTP